MCHKNERRRGRRYQRRSDTIDETFLNLLIEELEAMGSTLSDREDFLIGHHMDAQAYANRTIGAKALARLQVSEWFEDLLTLRDIDDRARRSGVDVCVVEDALACLEAMTHEDEKPF